MGKTLYKYRANYAECLNGIFYCNFGSILASGLKGPVLILPISLILVLLSRIYYKSARNCEEYKELDKLFLDVIKHLNNTREELDINTIEGIYEYTKFIINNGYVNCVDGRTKLDGDIKELKFNTKPIYDSSLLNYHCESEGYNLLLSYLMQLADYKSTVLSGSQVLLEEKRDKISEIKSEELKGSVVRKAIKEYVEDGNPQVKDLEVYIPGTKLVGDSVSVTIDGSKVYYLSPREDRIYVPYENKDNSFLSNQGTMLYIKHEKVKKAKSKLEIDDFTSLEQIDYQEFKKASEEYKKLIEDNKDVLDKMYTELKPTLEEAEEVFKAIKKILT